MNYRTVAYTAGLWSIQTVSEPAGEYAKKIEGLEVQVVGNRVVAYEIASNRIHYLNPTAALILDLCDGMGHAEEVGIVV